MSGLIQRYLDGELSEEQAEVFLTAVAEDPELAAELHAYEQVLATLAAPSIRKPTPELCDRVMERIADTRKRPVRPLSAKSRQLRLTRLAWAAGLIIVFGLGYLAADIGLGPAGTTPTTPGGSLNLASGGDGARRASQVATGPAVSSGGDLRLVRLVYVPQTPDVQKVSVAGSFNGWNPGVTPMQREGNVWVAQLILPPAAYEYMFVEDGVNWVTDPLAMQTRDDGFGKQNAVLDLTL